MIYILYKLSLKLKSSYLTAILICGRFCNKVVSKIVFLMKDYFHQVYLFESCEFGLFVVQLSRTDYRDKDNGQHTGSVIPRFGHSSWGTVGLSFISLIACIKNTEKNMIYINHYIANKASRLIDINCCYIITEWFYIFGTWPVSW